jgi:RNA polymerase sigma-70 factor, ECF subfamily
MEKPTGHPPIADRALQAELLREAQRLTRNAADAKDLVQDTLERGIRKSRSFIDGSLRAWLYHLMRNIFIDGCRRRRPAPLDVAQLPLPAPTVALPRWAQVTDETLTAALAQLEPISRDVFVLKEHKQMSYSQIAAELGIPMGTVATRLMRARQKLRAILISQIEENEGADVQVH